VSLVIVWSLTWLHILGIKAVGRFSGTMAALMMAPLVAIVALGWARLSWSLPQPLVPEGMPPGTALSHAMVWCLWSYSGYGALASAGEEIVDTERNYPRTLAIFLPLCVLSHGLMLMAALGATPDWTTWQAAHFTQVGFVLGGAWLAAATSLGAQLGGLGLFNGELLVVSRMPYAMARDGLLPQRLAQLHPRYQTPHVCLIVQAILYSVLTYFLSFTELLMVSTWMALPAYVLTFLTPIILRWKRPEIRGPFRIPGGWPGLIVTALCPILIALYALFEIDRQHILRGLAFMATGPILYFFSARRRRLVG